MKIDRNYKSTVSVSCSCMLSNLSFSRLKYLYKSATIMQWPLLLSTTTLSLTLFSKTQKDKNKSNTLDSKNQWQNMSLLKVIFGLSFALLLKKLVKFFVRSHSWKEANESNSPDCKNLPKLQINLLQPLSILPPTFFLKRENKRKKT